MGSRAKNKSKNSKKRHHNSKAAAGPKTPAGNSAANEQIDESVKGSDSEHIDESVSASKPVAEDPESNLVTESEHSESAAEKQVNLPGTPKKTDPSQVRTGNKSSNITDARNDEASNDFPASITSRSFSAEDDLASDFYRSLNQHVHEPDDNSGKHFSENQVNDSESAKSSLINDCRSYSESTSVENINTNAVPAEESEFEDDDFYKSLNQTPNSVELSEPIDQQHGQHLNEELVSQHEYSENGGTNHHYWESVEQNQASTKPENSEEDDNDDFFNNFKSSRDSPAQSFEEEEHHHPGDKCDLEDDDFYNNVNSTIEPPAKQPSSTPNILQLDLDDDFLDDDKNEDEQNESDQDDVKNNYEKDEVIQHDTNAAILADGSSNQPTEISALLESLEQDNYILSDDDDELNDFVSQLKASQTIQSQQVTQTLTLEQTLEIKPAQPTIKAKPSITDFQTDRKSFDLPMDFIPPRPKRAAARVVSRTSTPHQVASPFTLPPVSSTATSEVSNPVKISPKTVPRAPAPPPRAQPHAQPGGGSSSKYAPPPGKNLQTMPPPAQLVPPQSVFNPEKPKTFVDHTAHSDQPLFTQSQGTQPPLRRPSNPDPFGFPGLQDLTVKKRPSKVLTPSAIHEPPRSSSNTISSKPPLSPPRPNLKHPAVAPAVAAGPSPPPVMSRRVSAPQRVSRVPSAQSSSPYAPQPHLASTSLNLVSKESSQQSHLDQPQPVNSHQQGTQFSQAAPDATVSAYSYHSRQPFNESVFTPNPLNFANVNVSDMPHGSVYSQPLNTTLSKEIPQQGFETISGNTPMVPGPVQVVEPTGWTALSPSAMNNLPIPLLGPKGPLKNKTKDVIKWVDERIRELGSSPGSLLYKIIRALLKDPAEQKSLILTTLKEYRIPLEHVSVVQKRSSDVSQQIFSLLANGDRDAAFKFSLEAHEYSHALVIAQSLGKEQWELAVDQFVAEETRESAAPLAFVYRSLAACTAEAGRSAIAELKPRAQTTHVDFNKVDNNLRHWADCTAALFDTKNPGSTAALLELGKLLQSRGFIEQAQTCYILCNIPLGSSEFGFPLSVDGAESFTFDSYMIAEIYEFCLGLGIPSLLPHKLRFAELLAGAGHCNEGLKVAETVVSILKSLKNAPSQLTEAAAHVIERCSQNATPPVGGWLQRKLSRPNLEKAWVSSFNKFVSGEDDSDPNNVNRGTDNPVQRPSSATGPVENNLEFAPPQRQSYTPGPDTSNSFNGLSPVYPRPSSSSLARPATLAETEEEYAGQNIINRSYVPSIAPSRGYTPLAAQSVLATPAPAVNFESTKLQDQHVYNYAPPPPPPPPQEQQQHQGYVPNGAYMPPPGYPQLHGYSQDTEAPQSMVVQMPTNIQGYPQTIASQSTIYQPGFNAANAVNYPSSQFPNQPASQNQLQFANQFPNQQQYSSQNLYVNQPQFVNLNPPNNGLINQPMDYQQNGVAATATEISQAKTNSTFESSNARSNLESSHEPGISNVDETKLSETTQKEIKEPENTNEKPTHDRSDDSGTKSRGWFSWLKRDDPNSKKPIEVKLGNGPEVYYDKEIGRWVQKGQPRPEVKKGPPPPPKSLKSSAPVPASAISSTPSLPPGGSGTALQAQQSSEGPPSRPMPSPAGGFSSGSSGPASLGVPEIPAPPGQPGQPISTGPPSISAPPSIPGASTPKPKNSAVGGGIDDILAAANTMGRSKRRAPRNRYINTTETGMPQGMPT